MIKMTGAANTASARADRAAIPVRTVGGKATACDWRSTSISILDPGGPMGTNVHLTPELERFAQLCVESGRFNDVSEVVRSGLRMLQLPRGAADHVRGIAENHPSGRAGWFFHGRRYRGRGPGCNRRCPRAEGMRQGRFFLHHGRGGSCVTPSSGLRRTILMPRKRWLGCGCWAADMVAANPGLRACPPGSGSRAFRILVAARISLPAGVRSGDRTPARRGALCPSGARSADGVERPGALIATIS